MGLFSVACYQAPLLPKLRGHFAEFLNKGYPARLAIFLPPTCVGLRYGRLTDFLSSFSRQREFISFASLVHYASTSALRVVYFTATQPRCLPTAFHPRGLTILLFPCIGLYDGYGISTVCPSSTPFGLDLGPDLPWADEPSPGNLRLSTEEFLAPLSLLMPAFSLPNTPPPLTLRLLRS